MNTREEEGKIWKAIWVTILLTFITLLLVGI
jgi:hypothetical protein